jgi:cellulose synthase/poly-beta-1,6-N-acetylglucosamine synthase-like glycosyltransferase
VPSIIFDDSRVPLMAASTSLPDSVSQRTPPLSIAAIVPTYNYAHGIKQTIASVLNQTLPPVEIIVVDDGSTDGTRNVLDTTLVQIEVVRRSIWTARDGFAQDNRRQQPYENSGTGLRRAFLPSNRPSGSWRRNLDSSQRQREPDFLRVRRGP